MPSSLPWGRTQGAIPHYPFTVLSFIRMFLSSRKLQNSVYIQGSTGCHHSKTKRKYNGRDTFLKGQFFSPLANSIMNIFQSHTHNSNLMFAIFLPNHCSYVIYIKSGDFLFLPPFPEVLICFALFICDIV